jgi:hypothetical protein
MARNLHCGCLCHGTNGNRIGDEYFSCKNCYAANHMDHLPRKVVATKAAPKRKPLKKLEVKEGLKIGKDLVLDTKAVAKRIMSNIADAADALKSERTATEKRFDLGHRAPGVKQFTPAQAEQVTEALKSAMEAEHVCGDGSSCKHDTTMTVEPVEKPSGRKGVKITIA